VTAHESPVDQLRATIDLSAAGSYPCRGPLASPPPWRTCKEACFPFVPDLSGQVYKASGYCRRTGRSPLQWPRVPRNDLDRSRGARWTPVDGLRCCEGNATELSHRRRRPQCPPPGSLEAAAGAQHRRPWSHLHGPLTEFQVAPRGPHGAERAVQLEGVSFLLTPSSS
jgi:hypothetical protein